MAKFLSVDLFSDVHWTSFGISESVQEFGHLQ